MNLKISNISKTYENGVRALNNVSLNIPAGMYGLLGPNGAGKSTLMRILATLQIPDTGSIFLDDTDVVREKDVIRRTLGYLPQEFGLLKDARADELLDHFAMLKGILSKNARREAVDNLLRQTNLWSVRRQKLGGFSGGMRQRFGVAIALLGNPQLVIVDEPTAGLDPSERVRFLNLLAELGEESIVILSTHIVEDVSELCSKMAIINSGEILLETAPSLAMQRLKGNIWSSIIKKDKLKDIEHEKHVISKRLLGGQTLIRVFSFENPGNAFEAVEPNLGDVYFTTMMGWVVKDDVSTKVGSAL